MTMNKRPARSACAEPLPVEIWTACVLLAAGCASEPVSRPVTRPALSARAMEPPGIPAQAQGALEPSRRYVLLDARSACFVAKYELLNGEGREKLDTVLDQMVKRYPSIPGAATASVARIESRPPPAPVVQPAHMAPEPPAKPAPQPAVKPGPVSSVPVIGWAEAAGYYGRQVVVEGEVVSSYRSAAVCFLNFNVDFNKDFFAVIPSAAMPAFPPNPEAEYRGRRVRITGTVREYKGRPQILLESPKQIELMN